MLRNKGHLDKAVRRKGVRGPIFSGPSLEIKRVSVTLVSRFQRLQEGADHSSLAIVTRVPLGDLLESKLSLGVIFSSSCMGVVRRPSPPVFAPFVLMRCATGRTAVHGPALLYRVIAQRQLAGRLLLQPQLPDPRTLHLRRPLRQAGQKDTGEGWSAMYTQIALQAKKRWMQSFYANLGFKLHFELLFSQVRYKNFASLLLLSNELNQYCYTLQLCGVFCFVLFFYKGIHTFTSKCQYF